MKNTLKITGILLLMVVALSGCHRQRENKRERIAFRHESRMDKRSFYHGRMNRNRGDFYMGRPGMGRPDQFPGGGGRMMPGMRNGNMRFNDRGGMGMRRGMMRPDSAMMRQNGQNGRMGRGPMGQNGMGQMQNREEVPVGPGGIFIDNIPNVTEKQRAEYMSLIKKQQEEMNKMRTEMAAKIRNTMESNRSKLLNVFTAEQKKALGTK